MYNINNIIYKLSKFWNSYGCNYATSIDTEVGAATLSPNTFFRVLDLSDCNIYYLQQCKRSSDSRYNFAQNRVFNHHQFQVLLKPFTDNCLDLYKESLVALGLDIFKNDLKFYQDNWEHPALGASGIGWEVLLNGMEITQITYFKNCGGYILNKTSCEIAYGLERISLYIQDVNNLFDIVWDNNNFSNYINKYGNFFFFSELQWSFYNLDYYDNYSSFLNLNSLIKFSLNCLKKKNYIPAYFYLLKSSNLFNLMDSRGLLDNNLKIYYISIMRSISKKCASLYLKYIY